MTKLNEKPVILVMDKVFLNLEEPEVIKPLAPPSEKTHRKKKSLSGSPIKGRRVSNFVRDMKIMINEAHFTVKLLPRDEPNAPSAWSPHLRFDLLDVVIESTDGEWKVRKKKFFFHFLKGLTSFFFLGSKINKNSCKRFRQKDRNRL